MSEREYLQLMELAVGSGLLLLGYGYMYRRTRADRFREDLFTMRDDRFDYMWQNGISYELPAYQLMRKILNGMIRCADGVDLLPLLVFAYVTRDQHRPDRLSNAIQEIEDTAVRDNFIAARQKMRERIVDHFFLEGPQWIVFKPVQLAARHRRTAQKRILKMALKLHTWVNARADDWTDDCSELGKKNSPQAQLLHGNVRTVAGR